MIKHKIIGTRAEYSELPILRTRVIFELQKEKIFTQVIFKYESNLETFSLLKMYSKVVQFNQFAEKGIA